MCYESVIWRADTMTPSTPGAPYLGSGASAIGTIIIVVSASTVGCRYMGRGNQNTQPECSFSPVYGSRSAFSSLDEAGKFAVLKASGMRLERNLGKNSSPG